MYRNRGISFTSKYKIVQAVLLICAVILSGCASGPDKVSGPVFFPAEPNPPFIQHLRSITAMKDLGGGSAFAEFVLGKESNEALVNKPYGIAVHQDKIYVVDTRGPGYVVLDLKEKKHTLITGGGAGQMRKPINITIDNNGEKYVTDTGRNQVLVFDKKDRYVRAYGLTGQFKPGDVVLVGDRLYVSDLKHHLIQVLDKKSGKLLFKFAEAKKKKNKPSGKKGKKSDKDYDKGALYFPTNMAVYGKHLYISDTGYFKIVKYTLDGKFVGSYGEVGTGLGNFARPKGIALDKSGRLYVVDAAFENVQIFDKKENLLLFFGGAGSEAHNLVLPTSVFIDYENVKYFQQYAAPGFKLEYVIFVASQFGRNKINVYGYGRMQGMDYSSVPQ